MLRRIERSDLLLFRGPVVSRDGWRAQRRFTHRRLSVTYSRAKQHCDRCASIRPPPPTHDETTATTALRLTQRWAGQVPLSSQT